MKTKTTTFLILGLISLSAMAVPAGSGSRAQNELLSVDLIAGQHEDVGNLLVWIQDGVLRVEYRTEGEWCLTETHLAVEQDLAEIPQTEKHNPIPGRFEYSSEYESCIKNPDPYTIPWNREGKIYVSAHAVVRSCERQETAWAQGTRFTEKGSWGMYFTYPGKSFVCSTVLQPVDGNQEVVAQTVVSSLNYNLPSTVRIKVEPPTQGSYLDLYIDEDKDGEWDHLSEKAWCVDTEHLIAPDKIYEANTYLCGEDLTGVVDKPQNKRLIDEIIEYEYVGKRSGSDCDGDGENDLYTYGDVQEAIWAVIDNGESEAPYSCQQRVNEILEEI